MKYKILIGVSAFAAGFLVRSYFAPSGPTELQSALEHELAQNPVKNEQLIDAVRESSHQLKALAGSEPPQGYAAFRDLRLIAKEHPEGDISYLVNKSTNEELPVIYVDGKTNVGSYEHRLESIARETAQLGKEQGTKIVEKTNEMVDKIRSKEPLTDNLLRAKGYLIQKSRQAVGWLTRNLKALDDYVGGRGPPEK